ncbi:MAG TPA: hypothetical protein PKJ41_05955 [Bryobacteraceae bacterium]|nr:hypothetical protein [Bryobacteraceae bacterium]
MKLLLAVLFAFALPLAAADLTGVWDVAVEIGGNTGNPTITFKQDGNTLSGTYKGLLGEAPLKGTVDGAKVRWEFTAEMDGNKFTCIYAGVVDNGVIKGTIDFGGQAEGTFTAKRK